MSQADDPPAASVPDPAAAPGSDPSPTPAGASAAGGTPAPRPSARTWMIVLLGGLLAGLGGFAAGEYGLRVFAPSLELPPGIKGDAGKAPVEHARRLRVSQDQVSTLCYGALGALLGMVLGLAGGAARRSPGLALLAALLGLAAGGAAGAGTTSLVLPWYHANHASPSVENANQQLALSLATHGGIWAAVGLAAGLALGLGLGGRRAASTMTGGIIGAVLAAGIYEVAGAVVFPLDKTLQPIAMTPGPRLVAHLAVGLCVSACALWAADNLSLRRQPARARPGTISSAG